MVTAEVASELHGLGPRLNLLARPRRAHDVHDQGGHEAHRAHHPGDHAWREIVAAVLGGGGAEPNPGADPEQRRPEPQPVLEALDPDRVALLDHDRRGPEVFGPLLIDLPDQGAGRLAQHLEALGARLGHDAVAARVRDQAGQQDQHSAGKMRAHGFPFYHHWRRAVTPPRSSP